MRKLLTILCLSIFAFTSCSDDGAMGPQGPPGPEGPQGPAGADAEIGAVFDVEGDFTAENDYYLFVPYEDFTTEEVFETDVVLVYLRTAQDGEADGEPVYVWRLLPQTYYVEGGTVQYNYDYTFFEVNIFLNSDLDFSTLGTEFTDNQVFRIAILPAGFAEEQAIDVSNYNEVMSELKIQEENIRQRNIKK